VTARTTTSEPVPLLAIAGGGAIVTVSSAINSTSQRVPKRVWLAEKDLRVGLRQIQAVAARAGCAGQHEMLWALLNRAAALLLDPTAPQRRRREAKVALRGPRPKRRGRRWMDRPYQGGAPGLGKRA